MNYMISYSDLIYKATQISHLFCNNDEVGDLYLLKLREVNINQIPLPLNDFNSEHLNDELLKHINDTFEVISLKYLNPFSYFNDLL